MNTLEIRNWRKFQHYSRRNPPWIKLHVELLQSEDWVTWSDASRLLAVVCMMIAARNDGKIPENASYIKRVGYLDAEPDLGPLISCGFLLKVLADASNLQADASNLLARAETEAEAETDFIAQKSAKRPVERDDRFDAFWAACPRRVGKGQARRAFRTAVKKTDFETIMAGIKKYAESVAGKDQQYTAHPATWLNGERWEDAAPATKPWNG